MAVRQRESRFGQLLAEARQAFRPKPMSMKTAAARAGLGIVRWRQVETGITHVSGSGSVPTKMPPPESAARLAEAVRIAPEQLVRAAEELERDGDRLNEAPYLREVADALRAHLAGMMDIVVPGKDVRLITLVDEWEQMDEKDRARLYTLSGQRPRPYSDRQLDRLHSVWDRLSPTDRDTVVLIANAMASRRNGTDAEIPNE